MEKVKHIIIKENMKVTDLVGEMAGMGFGARNISKASVIMKQMFSDKECTVFLGLAGAMVPAGMKNIVVDMIKNKKIDVLVTTGANLTHDLIEALGYNHYQCDSWNDEEFHKKGYDRIYNVLMKNEAYEKLEDYFEKNWDVFSNSKTITEFLQKIGMTLNESENSILRACHENNIPIYCPALADSGIGLMVWGRKAKGKKITIDAFEDMKDIIDISWTSKKRGVIYIGGGVPKNFIQQSLQFSKGADYGVQITTDRAESGGSSGAPLKEGVSWGKMNPKANFVDVFCDATIAFPLIYASIK
jgi:deoxyhypusine synthase